MKHEWKIVCAGNEALEFMLLRFIAGYGDLAIFVRRFCWLPLDFPLRIDGGEPIPAEQILVRTETDAQVLVDYWIDTQDLLRLLRLIEATTADFEIYSSGDLTLVGHLSYFEWSFGIWARAELDFESLWTELSFLVSDKARAANDKLMDHNPGSDSRVVLSELGRSRAFPCSLTSDAAFARQHDLRSLRIGCLDQPQAIRLVCGQDPKYHEPSHLPSFFDPAELRSIEEGAQIGTYHFFDQNWKLAALSHEEGEGRDRVRNTRTSPDG